MKTKVELDIPDSSLDEATKKKIRDMNKKIASLERKLKTRDTQIASLRSEVHKLKEPCRIANGFISNVGTLMEAINDFQKEKERIDWSCGY
jgi:predicted RNase H-like nuclease (RuvC/YqgF family)